MAVSPPTSSARLATGIRGLDEVLSGGIPRGTLLLVEGRPGTGKTTLGLQILLHGVQTGERCLLVSNAETPVQLRIIAQAHDWNLADIEIVEWTEGVSASGQRIDDYTLFPEAEVEVGETLGQLTSAVEKFDPTLLVIDSISALQALAPTTGFYRRQLKRVRDFLSTRGCTTLVLDDASMTEMNMRSQTLADGIVELKQIDFGYGRDRRRIRVRKLRGSGYVSGAHDMSLDEGGITVHPRLVAQRFETFGDSAPLASGIAELDQLTGGGIPRGTSTLIVGPAGCGKSTVSAVYSLANAEQGKKSSVLLFDENVETYLARCRGLGMQMDAAIEAGLVAIEHLDPAELTAGQIANRLVEQVETEGIDLVTIDTLNGYLLSASEEPNILLHLRELVSYLARRRVVTILTMTQHGILGSEMTTPLDISFVADNVLLLRFFEAHGSIRQCLAVIKKRTGHHERTIREITLSSGGVNVGAPLRDFAGVLTGSPQYTGAASATDA